jgi:hypothetical protein
VAAALEVVHLPRRSVSERQRVTDTVDPIARHT